MALRLLVVEGNTRAAREDYLASWGVTPSDSYAAVLQRLDAEVTADVCFPADEGANLPDPAGLEGYDGIALTGSSLHLWKPEPATERQVELARAIYRSRTPAFGSCWGMQVAAVAAGGDVRKNPAGREIGVARNIFRTAAGRAHPLLARRADAYDAPAIHLDYVATPPEGATALASNALTPLQAAEIAHEGGQFWCVQYHPEFSLADLAALMLGMTDTLAAEGMAGDEDAAEAMMTDWSLLARDPARTDLAWRYAIGPDILDETRRLIEIDNWLALKVRPEKSVRGRA